MIRLLFVLVRVAFVASLTSIVVATAALAAPPTANPGDDARTPGTQTRISARGTPELIVTLKSDLPHKTKWETVQALRNRRESVPFLLELLKEDQQNARYYAIRTLGYIGDPRATPQLGRILLDRSYGPRRYAAIALGQISDVGAVDFLKTALTDTPHVRADALNALAKIDCEPARQALSEYHFSGATFELSLTISCNDTTYSVGQEIEVKAELTNTSENALILAPREGQPLGYLVVQGQDGRFIESVDTGREGATAADKIHLLPRRANTYREFLPGATLTQSFRGLVAMWTFGEKDDHAFLPTKNAFLTLNFGQFAFHIRQAGSYQLRLVFAQEGGARGLFQTANLPEHSINRVWKGRVVSAPCAFRVIEETSARVSKDID